MIKTKEQVVRAKPNDGDNRPIDKNGEAEVATVEVLDRASITDWQGALDWLVTAYTTPQAVVENFIRQDTQDISNRARADYKTGGDRAAKEARLAELLTRVAQGDLGAAKEVQQLLLKRK